MAEMAYPGTDRYSMAELMSIEIARNLGVNDGYLAATGRDSQIPFSAVQLARLTCAPNLWEWEERVEYFQSMYDGADLGMFGGRQKWGLGFNGGIQVDKYGNLNMIGIGPSYDNLQVRGPGTIGLTYINAQHRQFEYVLHHSRRIFVEKVDFISGVGFLDGGDARWEVMPRLSGGPMFVFTPLCVMDFEEGTKRMRLRSVNPGYTVEDVVANTGFELILPEKPLMTMPPTDNELMLLRTLVDKDGVLRKMTRLTVG